MITTQENAAKFENSLIKYTLLLWRGESSVQHPVCRALESAAEFQKDTSDPTSKNQVEQALCTPHSILANRTTTSF